HNQLDRVRVRFWRRAAWHPSSRRSASTASECGVQGYCEAGDGTGRDDGCPCSRPAGRLGQGFIRCAERELTQMSTNIVLLDRLLAQYGPETKEARTLLRGAVDRILDQIWSKGTSASGVPPPFAAAEILYAKIQGLAPKDDAQRSFQSQALSIGMDLRKTRWLMYEQETGSVSIPLLARAGSLAHYHLHQFRPLRPFQYDRGEQLVRLRAVGFGRDLLDLGDVHALLGTHSDLQRSVARRPRASRPVAEEHNIYCPIYIPK